MSSPKNIQRDCTWCNPKTSLNTPWASASQYSDDDFKVNGPAALATSQANAHADSTAVTVATNTFKAIGIFIDPPMGDNTPYRIKASAAHEDCIICIGYAPSTITGSDDVIEDPYYFPFQKYFDDIIIVPALAEGDTYYGRALCIALALNGAIASSSQPGQISVQNLGTKPPTMQNAVS